MAEDKNETIARLRDQFEDHCEALNGLHLQSCENWLGKREGKNEHGKWKSKATEFEDPEVWLQVSDWKEIPYVNALTFDNLSEDIEFARTLQDWLTQMFARREFGLTCSNAWGLPCGLASSFETLLDAKPENWATARTLASGHTQENKKAQSLGFLALFGTKERLGTQKAGVS